MLNKSKIIAIVIITLILGGLAILNFSTATEDTKKVDIETTQVETKTSETTTNTTTTKKTTKKTTAKKVETTRIIETKKAGTYKLTHYGPDCKGCSGNTASGYKVSNTIYYNDNVYGKLRIVAIKDLPLYSVIKIKNYKLGGDIYAIVLDRGVGSGVIDLLVESEKKASGLGIQNGLEIQILRSGK